LNVKVIIFDLDDTLYAEIEYVKSGLKQVSKYFSILYNLDKNEFYNQMINILEKKGRVQIFDEVLKKFGYYTKLNVQKALSVYRTHIPKIKLNHDVLSLLTYYQNKDIPLYIVTDGNKIVQDNKIKALGLEKYVKKVFITHRHGRIHAKPSTYCFEKILTIEKVDAQDAVYIADNINKDFVNIKKLGFNTIRIKQGMFKDLVKSNEYNAKVELENLVEIKEILEV